MSKQNDVIEILFGVKGGGSISGESGALIKKDLEAIASQVPLKLNIDRTHFTAQLKSLRAEIDKTLGNLQITIKQKATNTSSSGTSNDSTDNAAANQIKLYQKVAKELDKYRNKLYSTTQLMVDQNSNTVRNTNTWTLYSQQVTDLATNLENLKYQIQDTLNAAPDSNLGQKFEELKQQSEVNLNNAVNEKTAKEQDKYANSIIASYDKIVSKGHQLYSTYDDLIRNNKTAQEAFQSLQNVMNIPLSDNYAEASAQVNLLKNRVNETSATLSRLAVETDTVGNKIKKAFNTAVVQKIAYAFLALAGNALNQVYKNVLLIDEAITDLQIATGYTRERTAELVQSYGELANQLGATVTEITAAADTWLRQGYNVAETNQLITATLMLSKLGQIDSAEAARHLTSAMKGYKVAVEDCIEVVDKLTAVDMEAATSAGDIATAMAETAASAEIAGVSMDKLIGYISTVAEVTQDGAESVGIFYKTLFARMGNIKVGNFVSDDGEALNDVEKVLNSLGISLRDSNGLFRDFGDVLDEVGQRWKTYDNVQQHAIATAFAGTRQQEKFIVLMENYGTALEYANTAANSLGTAESKYSAAYLDSIDAKVNSLTASWQTFSQNLINSDIIKALVDFLNMLVKIADFLQDGAIWVGFAAAGIAAFNKIKAAAQSYFKDTNGLIAYNNLVPDGQKLTSVTQFKLISEQLKKMSDAYTKLNAVAGDTDLEKLKLYNQLFPEAPIDNMTDYENKLVELEKKHTEYGQLVAETNKVTGASFIKLGKQIASALVLATLVTVLTVANEKLEGTNKVITGIIVLVGALTAAVLVLTNVIKANPILAIVSAVLGGIQLLVSGIQDCINKTTKLKEEAIEAAQESKDSYENAKSELESLEGELDSTISRIEELQEASANGEITFVEQEELEKLERAQELLESEIALQQSIVSAEQEQATKDAIKAIQAIRDEASPDASGWSKFWNGAIGTDVETTDDYVNKIFDSWDTATDEEKSRILTYYNEIKEQADTLTYYNEDNLQDWQRASNEAYDYSHKLMHQLAIAQKNEDVVWDNVFAMNKYDDAIDKLKELANTGNVTYDTLQQFANSNPEVKEMLDYLQELGLFSWDSADAVGTLTEKVQALADAISVISKVSYSEYLDANSDLYSGLADAIDEIIENGTVSEDTIQDLLENFPDEVEKYFELNGEKGGYVLRTDIDLEDNMDILTKQAEEQLSKAYQEYLNAMSELALHPNDDFTAQLKDNVVAAEENYNNLIAALATLIKDPYIETQKELLEEQKSAYEDQMDEYLDLIDLRKQLLETYQEEVDYRRELNKKQNNVADLQTQLALARLDTSAAGQARARQLQSELDDAQEELDDFTLDKAIERLEDYLDADSQEYEAFINQKVAELQETIDNLAKKFKFTVTEDSQTGKVTVNPSYHTGGFVGNLKSNEEFAKLLKGEFVATQGQMNNFMRSILPSVVARGLGTATINNNSPLVSITCDSIDKDTLPTLKNIINQAVEQIEKRMESALARSGYKK